MSSRDFDWNSDPNIAVPEQAAIAVYLSIFNEILIRQAAGPCDEEDSVVILRPENAARVARAILQLANQPGDENEVHR